MNVVDLSLAALSILLCLILERKERAIRRARADRRYWEKMAKHYANSADLNARRSEMWRMRALHPNLRPYWEVIESAVPDDEGKPR